KMDWGETTTSERVPRGRWRSQVETEISISKQIDFLSQE
ncbi:hypothetical protein A2U01_0061244, partial [Trifolium medium]|nr:hypothetical protein [Trifolium medium]